jgi:type VII secretion protein EccB
MASRTQQMQSHQFTLQRVTAALAVRDPDAVASPVRRSAGTAFAGVMIAVVALAAVAAYGVLRPGDNTTWRDGRSVIIERETGARFVYRDGVLHPTLNYASALLILGSAQPATAIVSHASLAGVPRGVPLGIPGAPDPLPAVGDLLTGAWTVCSRVAAAAAASPGLATPPVESLLVVGAPASADGVAGQPVGAGQAVLAQDRAGGYHLLWNGHRYAIRDPDVVLTALTWRGRPPVLVADALLNTLPPGQDLAPLAVAGHGHPSRFSGHRVGEVVKVESQSGSVQFGLVRAEGIAAITQIQADLLLADPANGLGGAAQSITQAQFASAPAAASLVPSGDTAPPATTPDLASPGEHGGVCAAFTDAANPPALTVLAARPVAAGETRTVQAPVDWVAVQPGRGAIVDAVAAPNAPSGLLGVVSDLGVLFPVPSTAVLATLGFGAAAPHVLPSALVALLPRGNALDPTAAGVAPA